MKRYQTSDWLIPGSLLLLAILPMVGGAHRVAELIVGARITEANARFFAAPLPIMLHVISCSVYFILGAFQFSPKFRRSNPAWHRAAGRVLIPAGLVSAASGMWMAAFYPPLFGNGVVITYIRLFVGVAMSIFICLGFVAIRQRAFANHRTWMIRTYALAIAAGTQPLTLGLAYAVRGNFDEPTYTSGLAAGWLVNMAVAEWIIRRNRTRSGSHREHMNQNGPDWSRPPP